MAFYFIFSRHAPPIADDVQQPHPRYDHLLKPLGIVLHVKFQVVDDDEVSAHLKIRPISDTILVQYLTPPYCQTVWSSGYPS